MPRSREGDGVVGEDTILASGGEGVSAKLFFFL